MMEYRSTTIKYAPDVTPEWFGSDDAALAKARKAIATQHDEIENLFGIIKTLSGEIDELRQKVQEYRAWAGGGFSALKDRLDALEGQEAA